MTWTIEPPGADYFVSNPDGRRLGPFSDGEARAVSTALNGLTRVRLLRSVMIPGGPGQIGQVVDVPAPLAQEFVAYKTAEVVSPASAPAGVHDLRGGDPMLKTGRITTRRRST